MSAAKLNIKIEKGVKFTKKLTWQDSSRVPVPLSSYSARMQIRERLDSVAFEIELTSDAGDIVLESGGNIGQIDITIGATVTDAMTITSGVYDLELFNPGDVNDVVKPVEGLVEITGGVTR